MKSLTINLSSLDIDKKFILQAKQLGLLTLEDIMKINLPILRKHEHFSYLWYFDLLQILEKRGLLDEFEKRQL